MRKAIMLLATVLMTAAMAKHAAPIPDAPQIIATDQEIAIIREGMQEDLFDADTAKFRDVRKVTAGKNKDMICGLVNAKNRMGAYVGFHRFMGKMMILPPNKPDFWLIGVGHGSDDSVDTLCRQTGLGPPR